MRCANPDTCRNTAHALYRLFPTFEQRALCEPCYRRLSAMGLHLIAVETGWRARALAHDLPTKATYR